MNLEVIQVTFQDWIINYLFACLLFLNLTGIFKVFKVWTLNKLTVILFLVWIYYFVVGRKIEDTEVGVNSTVYI